MKLFLLITFVLSVSLLRGLSAVQFVSCLACLGLGAAAARLPIFRVFRASLLVIPFVGLFSLIVYLSGDVHRAWFILGKSYLSALSVLVCISATPMAQLLRAAQFFRIPGLLLEVTQMIYRYLFVLSAQAHAMQTAFRSRGGRSGTRALRASSAMIAVLFTKSYAKATMIHQAMLGRGFTGSLPGSEFRSLRIQELAIVSAGLVVAIALHFV